MKGFIELSGTNGKFLVNINSIGFIQEIPTGCKITFNAVNSKDQWVTLKVNESYDSIKDEIRNILIL